MAVVSSSATALELRSRSRAGLMRVKSPKCAIFSSNDRCAIALSGSTNTKRASKPSRSMWSIVTWLASRTHSARCFSFVWHTNAISVLVSRRSCVGSLLPGECVRFEISPWPVALGEPTPSTREIHSHLSTVRERARERVSLVMCVPSTTIYRKPDGTSSCGMYTNLAYDVNRFDGLSSERSAAGVRGAAATRSRSSRARHSSVRSIHAQCRETNTTPSTAAPAAQKSATHVLTRGPPPPPSCAC